MSDFKVVVYKKVRMGSGCFRDIPRWSSLSLVMSAVEEADMLQLLPPLYSLSLLQSYASNIRREQVGIGFGLFSMQ